MAIAIKWFPPSWIQIKVNNKIIYIDPAYLRTYFTKYPKKIEFSKWPDPIDGLPEKLPKGDLILITHDHADHCKKVTIDRLRKKNTLVIGPKRCAKKVGEELRIVEPGQEISMGKIKIKAVEAYNTKQGSSSRKVHHKGNGVGYLITACGKTIYHAGDTDFIPEMQQLGYIDVAMLPIGGTYTMNIVDAFEAAAAIKPAMVIPIHHLKSNPQEFQEKMKSRSDIMVLQPKIGELHRLF